MSRRLPVDDVGLWRRAMRNVAPLRGRPALQPEPDRLRPARPLSGAEAGETQAVRILVAPRPSAPLDRFAGVDRATADRLKRGRTPVEARLDLHGMTQAEAHRALSGFIPRSRAGGRRCVLVITGHGRATGGILKAAVPRWLAEPELRPHLLGIAPARPQDGGAGALYVLLRRQPH